MDIEQRRERQRSLTKQFQDPEDQTGQAFQTLCKAGMNEEYFKNVLFSMLLTPHQRKRKAYNKKDVERLETIASDLESASREFQKDHGKLFGLLASSSVTEWPIELDELIRLFSDLASCIRQSLEGEQLWRTGRILLAADTIPVLIDTVKRITGSEHYKELAVLLSAVYDEWVFEDALKAAMSRYRKKHGKPKKSG